MAVWRPSWKKQNAITPEIMAGSSPNSYQKIAPIQLYKIPTVMTVWMPIFKSVQ
jgi:hypothetical protein